MKLEDQLLKNQTESNVEDENSEQGHFESTPVEKLIPEINMDAINSYQEIEQADEAIMKKYGNPFRTGRTFLSHWFDEFLREYSYSHEEESLLLNKIEEIFKDKIIVDLGTGDTREGYDLAQLAGAKAYVAVEPFHGKKLKKTLSKEMSEEDVIEYSRNEHEIDSECECFKELIKTQISLAKNQIPYSIVEMDMLSFLKTLPADSVSVLACGIDRAIITDENQKIINEEISRVVHENGGFFSYYSHLEGSNMKSEDLLKKNSSYGMIIYKKK